MYPQTTPFYRYWDRNRRCVDRLCKHRWLHHGGPQMECSILNCACASFQFNATPFLLATGEVSVGRPFLAPVADLDGLDALYRWLCDGARGVITLEYDDCHD